MTETPASAISPSVEPPGDPTPVADSTTLPPPARPGALARIGRALGPIVPFIAPALLTLIIAGASLWLSSWMAWKEGIQIWRISGAEVDRLGSSVTVQLEHRIRDLERLAISWEPQGEPTPRHWDEATDRLLRQENQYRALVWLGPSNQVLRVAPPTERLPGFSFDPADDDRRLNELDRVARPETFMSPSIELSSGRREMLVSAPLAHGNQQAGRLIAVIRLRDLIDAVVHDSFVRGFTVSVFEGPYQLFGPNWESAGPESEWSRYSEIKVGDVMWRLRVWPGPELLKELRTRASRVVLAWGILLALICGAGAYRLDEWRRRALAAESARETPAG